jgi:FMN phosphatase YigB (HAD superfamily)
MNKLAKSLDKLFVEYDRVRALAKESDREQKELAGTIKARLEAEKLDSVDTSEYVCTYKFDKDKENEVFDEEKFQKKDPKNYEHYVAVMEEIKALTKKYTKIQVTPGARKLIVTRKEQE